MLNNALIEDILVSLGERVPYRNRYKIAGEAVKAIIRNDLKLLLVDEADQLNKDSFEFLRYIFSEIGCPIITCFEWSQPVDLDERAGEEEI